MGWSSPSVVTAAVLLFGLVAWWVLAVKGDRPEVRTPFPLRRQLLLQLSLLVAVEGTETVIGAVPLAGLAGTLHDPVVVVGLVAQLTAAAWVTAGGRLIERCRIVVTVPHVVPASSAPTSAGRTHGIPELLPHGGSLGRRGPPARPVVSVRS